MPTLFGGMITVCQEVYDEVMTMTPEAWRHAVMQDRSVDTQADLDWARIRIGLYHHERILPQFRLPSSKYLHHPGQMLPGPPTEDCPHE